MPDWMYITSLAYQELYRAKIDRLPIDPRSIKFSDILVLSFQRYGELAGCEPDDVACGLEAYVVRGLRPGLNLVLYDAAVSDARKQHTLWHEIGHIRLCHKGHGDTEEIEANFFAQQANAPSVLIRELEYRGYAITEGFLMGCFGISRQSAKKKLDYLARFPDAHYNPYDQAVLSRFEAFLNETYPAKAKVSMPS